MAESPIRLLVPTKPPRVCGYPWISAGYRLIETYFQLTFQGRHKVCKLFANYVGAKRISTSTMKKLAQRIAKEAITQTNTHAIWVKPGFGGLSEIRWPEWYSRIKMAQKGFTQFEKLKPNLWNCKNRYCVLKQQSETHYFAHKSFNNFKRPALQRP